MLLQSSLCISTDPKFSCFDFSKVKVKELSRIAKGLEMVREKKFFAVREKSESGKIEII